MELTVHEYVVPVTLDARPITTTLPEHVSVVATLMVASGMGFTVIWYVYVVPGHGLAPCVAAETVYDTVMGALVVLVNS